MAEQTTCHEWRRVYEGSSLGVNPRDVGRNEWRVRGIGWMVTGYCPVCGTRLNADGSTTPMVPAVTSNDRWLNDTEWRAVESAVEEYASECCTSPGGLLVALRQYRVAGDYAALQQGAGHGAAKTLAAWASHLEYRLEGEHVRRTPMQWLAAAYDASGEQPPGPGAEDDANERDAQRYRNVRDRGAFAWRDDADDPHEYSPEEFDEYADALAGQTPAAEAEKSLPAFAEMSQDDYRAELRRHGWELTADGDRWSVNRVGCCGMDRLDDEGAEAFDCRALRHARKQLGLYDESHDVWDGVTDDTPAAEAGSGATRNEEE